MLNVNATIRILQLTGAICWDAGARAHVYVNRWDHALRIRPRSLSRWHITLKIITTVIDPEPSARIHLSSLKLSNLTRK